MKKKSILVTGGTGFIGTNLVKKLLSLGNKVIAVDCFYSSARNKTRLFKNQKNFHFIEHDVRKRLILNQKIDEIYNLACPASPPIYQKDPIFTIETSVLGVKNMLDLAAKHKAKFLQSSTSEIYGNPLEHPQKESYWGNVNPIGPRSCYDEGKRMAETLCYEYFKKGVDVRVIRIFNTYGPHMDTNDGRVVSNFIVQALKNKDLAVYGDGSQTRSFCYIDDLIEGMRRFMDIPKRYFGPINLGNPQEFTVLELADLVLKLIPKSKSKIIFKPLPKDDPIKRKPDINLSKEVLGWEPTTDLKTGLKKTIEYFKKIIDNKNL